MGWFKQKTSNNQMAPAFFKGINIAEQLFNSSYGKIVETMKTLFNISDLSKFELPKVIVIGNESTGKSSLLENITKCQIFPKDSKICTKCPIKLIINENSKSRSKDSPCEIIQENNPVKYVKKEEIYENLCNIMKQIPDNIIIETEITIKIFDSDLPTFEFIDLPGIRAYPPEMATATMDLCKKYLANKNAIIICVVPATITRLTSCQSIAILTEMNVITNSILVLTMVDRVQEENIDELLIKRIINSSDEVRNLKFASIVGVINRFHTNTKNLIDNDKFENQWFNDNIINNIPQEYEKYFEKISNNLTISKLIVNMDTLYKNYININWKPNIIAKINKKISGLELKYKNLGDVVDTVIDISVLNEIYNEILLKLYHDLEVNKLTSTAILSDTTTFEYKNIDNIIKIITTYMQQYIIDYVNTMPLNLIKTATHEKYIVNLNRFSFANKKFIQIINDCFCNLFDVYNEQLYNDLTMHIKYMLIRPFSSHKVRNINTPLEYNTRIKNIVKFLYAELIVGNCKNFAINFIKDDYIENEEYMNERANISNELKMCAEKLENINKL